MTEKFANAVYDVLVAHVGAPPGLRDNFVFCHVHDDPPCREYLFRGKLGFGGKYRSERNEVDCYDETHGRQLLIAECNRMLSFLNSPITTEASSSSSM